VSVSRSLRRGEECYGQPYIICALFDDDAVVHDVDIIRLVQDMQGVRHEDARPTGQRPVEDAVIHDLLRDVCVQRTQGVVQQSDVGLRVRRSCQGDASLREK
jgi:hypothetical protein